MARYLSSGNSSDDSYSSSSSTNPIQFLPKDIQDESKRCTCKRKLELYAKCNDGCMMKLPSGTEIYADFPSGIGGDNESLETSICLDCGKVETRLRINLEKLNREVQSLEFEERSRREETESRLREKRRNQQLELENKRSTLTPSKAKKQAVSQKPGAKKCTKRNPSPPCEAGMVELKRTNGQICCYKSSPKKKKVTHR